LINVKKSKDDSIENWIALAARHENSLYYLFHECVSISTPFFDWSQVGCDYMAMGTTDPAHPANRKAKDVEINLEELLRDDRITPQDVEEIIKETDQLKEFTLWQKIRFEVSQRLLSFLSLLSTSLTIFLRFLPSFLSIPSSSKCVRTIF